MKVGLAGRTLAYKNQGLTLHHHGVPEQVWMDLDYSPVPDGVGWYAGVIAIVVETTERMLTERRLATERKSLPQTFEQAPDFIISMHGLDSWKAEQASVSHPPAQSSVSGRRVEPFVVLTSTVRLPSRPCADEYVRTFKTVISGISLSQGSPVVVSTKMPW